MCGRWRGRRYHDKNLVYDTLAVLVPLEATGDTIQEGDEEEEEEEA